MEILKFLQSIRIPFLTDLMLAVTDLGDETAFLVAALIMFWSVDKRKGYYILSIGFLGTIANQFMKLLFKIPRPWVLQEGIAVEDAMEGAGGYSFPSGHSQTAVGTFGCIAATQKKNWIRWICIAIMILVPLSRMYVGVHTPADVLVGSGMALAMVFLFRPLMLGNGKKNIPVVLAALTVLSVAYLLYVELYPFPADLDPHNYESAVKNGYTFVGCFVGLLIVWFVDEKKLQFTNEAVWWAQILKAVLGLAVVMLVKEGTKGVLNAILGDEMIARAVRYCLVVLTAGVVWPLTFKWFAKLGKKES